MVDKIVYNEYPHFAQLAVGAYRIRPENIHVDKCTHSGVCDTPLRRLFVDIYIVYKSLLFLSMSRFSVSTEAVVVKPSCGVFIQ